MRIQQRVWMFSDINELDNGHERMPPSEHRFHEDGDHPIYPTSTCTKGQLFSLVIAFFLRHRITKEALQYMLALLNIVIPNCISKTKYFIDRYFLKGNKEFFMHYYYPECETYLCNDEAKDPIVKGEIYSGECYRGVKVQSFLRESPYNFTMSFSADGIAVYESSSYSIWPIFLYINELDFHEKSAFLSISTSWHGDSKPKNDTFLIPFVKDAQHLHDHGFQWKDSNGILRKSKVMFLLCTADAPARAMLSNMTQYNGENGCG